MKLVIVGGGTAGWLAALYFKMFGNNYNISVIESSEIGILGAGESSTPNLKGILKKLKIDPLDFLVTTKATIKTANYFINWSPNDDGFFHKFNKLDNIFDFNIENHGYHFDAKECAFYFKEIGKSRGITHIDAIISNFTQKENGDVTNIHLKNGRTINCDYIIDCSGFARLLIGNLYQSKWKSYSDYLPLNSALAYFLPQTNKINHTTTTQTKSIAMKNGWMWQAPLQHRWGCGYAFDNRYITIDDAKKEVEDYLNKEIKIVKTFKFDAGGYEKTWINNCVSLGLASGFLEPLEGTSLMSLIWSIYKLNNLGGIENENSRDLYNEYVNNINHQNMVLVKHHYNCGRNDTEFWNNNSKAKNPIELKKIYEIGIDNITDDNLYTIFNTDRLMFGSVNYKTIDTGHKIKSKNKKSLI